MRESVTIPTPEGLCPAHLLRPEVEEPLPALIFYMDAFGIRPALVDMAERVARLGCVVLLPDLYFRYGSYGPFDPKEVTQDPNWRQVVSPMRATTGNLRAAQDTASFLPFLDNREEVKHGKVAMSGYCMGGGMALTAAGMYPDRVALAASFHGGQLASDASDSPHLQVPKMKGYAYVAGADRDATYPPEMAERLAKALTDGGVQHHCEIYQGALHGWMMVDHPVYNEAAAQRHDRQLKRLLAVTLG